MDQIHCSGCIVALLCATKIDGRWQQRAKLCTRLHEIHLIGAVDSARYGAAAYGTMGRVERVQSYQVPNIGTHLFLCSTGLSPTHSLSLLGFKVRFGQAPTHSRNKSV